jgi:cbb3-type cytochrome oxidase subunit 3
MTWLNVNLDIVRGVILVLLMIGFFGIWAWAWNSKRKSVFHAASMSPLEEDKVEIPEPQGAKQGTRE